MPLPSLTSETKSFGYSTVKQRWPKIIQGCIDDLAEHPDLIPQFQKLLKEIENDEKISQFSELDLKLNKDLQYYNDAFVDCHWHNGPWLYLECYLYQRIHLIFLEAGLPEYDIFNKLKQSTLVSSEFGIAELCKKLASFDFNLPEKDKFIYFKEFVDISLWGNSTDLSLLAGDVSLEDIKSIQGEEIRKQNEKNILANDTEKVFKYLSADKPGRVDIILDNSGFELFSDLVLGMFLIESKMANNVTFHCKTIPWFVSDTLIKDFNELFRETAKFNNEHVDLFVKKIKSYILEDRFTITNDNFWTLSNPFWDLPKFPIYDYFKTSKLLIFKGDLNYRKLTGDLWWDKTTPFSEAIKDLSTANLPILSLRTCKADVVVGLPEGLEEKLLAESGEFWAASGKYAVIIFFKP